MKKVTSGRHCVQPVASEAIAAVPGLSQVLTACDLLTTSAMTSVSVSIASGEFDSQLIALSAEVAEESGISMDCELRGRMLVLRFTKERPG